MEIKKERSLDLYYNPQCRYCQETLKWLEDHNITDVVTHNLEADPTAKETLVEIGGEEAYPCLIADGKAHYGEGAIIEFLTKLKGLKEEDIAG